MRSSPSRFALTLLCLAAAAVPAAPVPAGEPLPAFELLSPESTPVSSAAIAGSGRRLLVYLGAGCEPCTGVLERLKAWRSPALQAAAVLIVDSEPAAAGEFLAQALPAELRALPWYADPQGQAWSALQLGGVPVLLGVEDGAIAWRWSGLGGDAEALQAVVRSWVEAPPQR